MTESKDAGFLFESFFRLCPCPLAAELYPKIPPNRGYLMPHFNGCLNSAKAGSPKISLFHSVLFLSSSIGSRSLSFSLSFFLFSSSFSIHPATEDPGACTQQEHRTKNEDLRSNQRCLNRMPAASSRPAREALRLARQACVMS